MDYNLARGGFDPTLRGNDCGCGCAVNDCGLLPKFLQPEQKANYQFRDKIAWHSLIHELDRRYGKQVTDLEVGDRLVIFLQPNHATLKSWFIDFKAPVAGFKFELKAFNGADYAGKTKKSVYSVCGGIDEVAEDIDSLDTGTIEERTCITHFVDDGYNAKVDALVLEITGLPENKIPLREAQMLFARRYEQDGYAMSFR